MLFFAVIVTLAVNVYDYFTEDAFNFTASPASVSACAAAGIPLFAGLKKIREELDRRGSSVSPLSQVQGNPYLHVHIHSVTM